MILKNANYFDENYNLIQNIDLEIKSGIIHKIQKSKIHSNRNLDASDFIILPSFINAHFHLGETIFRGRAPRTSLEDYLKFTSNKSKHFDENDYKVICNISLIEAIKSGTSIISCARGWEDVKNIGIKGGLGYPIMNSDKLKDFYLRFKNNFKETEVGSEFYNSNLIIRKDLWIHSLNYIEIKMLKQISNIFSRFNNLRLSIHVAETEFQRNDIISKYGISEIEILEKYKLLNERTNLIHCNYVSKKELELIKKNRANITICPTSNLYFNNKLPNLHDFLDKNINISIATDGLATNNSANLLEALKITDLFYKGLKLSEKAYFDMITKHPAKTLGFPNCGCLKIGNAADLYFFSLKDSRIYPLEHLLKNIILNPISPCHLMVNGEFIMKNQKLLNINEDNIVKKYTDLTERL